MENATIKYKKVQAPALEGLRFNGILKKLLTGEYTGIAKRASRYRKSVWCIYTGHMHPLRYIGKRSFDACEELLY